LGIQTDLIYLYTFQYQARFGAIGSEREICAVYIGRYDHPLRINHTEISECKYFSIDDLDGELKNKPDIYTPWFRMEWQRLLSEYKRQIESCCR
jgi:isopentenyl-diphosphate delta-isomerase